YATTRGGAHTVAVVPNSVAAIDARTGRVVADVPVGHQPGPIATGPGAVWVLDLQDHTVSHVDPATRQLVATIPVAATPTDLAVGGGTVWVTDVEGSLIRIDPNADRVARVERIRPPQTQGAGPSLAV